MPKDSQSFNRCNHQYSLSLKPTITPLFAFSFALLLRSTSHFSNHPFIFALDFALPTLTVAIILTYCVDSAKHVSSKKELEIGVINHMLREGRRSMNLCSEYGTPYNITEELELRIGRRFVQLYTRFWSRSIIFWILIVSVPTGGVYLHSISNSRKYPPRSSTDVHPVGLKPNTLSHLPFQCSKYSSRRSDVIVCNGTTCTLQLYGSSSRRSTKVSSSWHSNSLRLRISQ